MTDLVQVQFKTYTGNRYGGRAYTYRAAVPLAVGDIVTVPTKNGDSEARVCRIDVPESEIPPFCGELRTITEPGTPEGSLFDGFM